MEATRSYFAPVFRAFAVVVAGAILLGSITAVVHKPRTPYYAQLAAKAAKVAPQKKTGDQNGFAYVGNDSQ